MIKYPQKPAVIMAAGNLYLNYEKKKVSTKNPLAPHGFAGEVQKHK